jgi:TorA maturation chaperone TorD
MPNNQKLLSDFAITTATDLRLLADLHAQELSNEALQALTIPSFAQLLGWLPQGKLSEAIAQMDTAIEEWQTLAPQTVLDTLATDFAAIYLTGHYRASPSESAWTDDEELVCQDAMFEVRELYQAYDLKVPSWRIMADDHLVNELLFVAHLLEKSATQPELLRETAKFMDEHLMRWLLVFTSRVIQRCDTLFYASLALITGLYCDQLRDTIADILGEARPTPEEIEARIKARSAAQAPAVPLQYFPGTAPSW